MAKTRQVCSLTLLGEYRYYKCEIDVNMRKSAKSVLDKDIRMRVMLKDDIELDCGDKVEILGRNGEVCETLMVAMKPVYHEDLICGGFGNLDVYLVDRDG